MVDQRGWVHMLSVICRSCVWEIDVWVLPALLQRSKGWGVSLSVLIAAHCIKLVCMAVVPEGSLFLRWCTRKPANSLLKTSRLRTWITGSMSCGLMRPRFRFRWCQACVVANRWWVQRQVCLAYSQAWGWECCGLGLHECCRHWGATVHWGNHECQHVLWYTEAEHDLLPWRLGRRAVFQHDNNHCLAKEAEGKGDGLTKHVSRPKPDWASVGHPQMESGGVQGV